MKNYESNVEQLELLGVKESNEKRVPAKRVDIVSLRLVKETNLLYKDRAIRSPEDGYNLFKQFLGELDREYFVVMCLDVKNQPTAINVCHIGSLNASIVHPREVMKAAILSNAASILSLHNHPSGQPEPSPEDIDVTKRLAEAGNIMGIELLDHLVVGDGRFVSLKNKGTSDDQSHYKRNPLVYANATRKLQRGVSTALSTIYYIPVSMIVSLLPLTEVGLILIGGIIDEEV